MDDIYRVLPHRDVLVQVGTDNVFGSRRYTHRPCGMLLKEGDVKDANWCPFCAATINKAAARRGRAQWSRQFA